MADMTTYSPNDLVKLTNCRLAIGDQLIPGDLWICASTGKIIDQQDVFYKQAIRPSAVHDLGGRILAPGLIDVQLNGGWGFDFSVPTERPQDFKDGVQMVNKQLIKTGVTSYLPTIISSRSDVYEKNLPFLSRPKDRNPTRGSESLGAHCEGPFLNPLKNGIHNKSVLQTPIHGVSSLESIYGSTNLRPETIALITLAPELPGALSAISSLSKLGIITSGGHSNATYAEMWHAVSSGVTMVTHMFNAMEQPHHRSPGIFGILGAQEGLKRPYYGIIADDIHVHPSFVRVAHGAHPEGTILVTDAMSMLGLPDGVYSWTHGERIKKTGGKLTLGEGDTIAGSSVTLVECLGNFLNWTGVSLAEGIRTVTETPAKMLGIEERKGMLRPGADADLVVLNEVVGSDGNIKLTVEKVYKFGAEVYSAGDKARL
ncbi:hypothetical protein BZA77DRAFT_339171 [Pyronema omphalodes]|nr:hypothetical protein BZA77DRAFT_339171 [Pyronema omphalodes]